jgi:hypothetical protein
MRFRPANISLINRRHYLPRLLLILSSKRQIQKPPQPFEDVDRSHHINVRLGDDTPGTRTSGQTRAGNVHWPEVVIRESLFRLAVDKRKSSVRHRFQLGVAGKCSFTTDPARERTTSWSPKLANSRGNIFLRRVVDHSALVEAFLSAFAGVPHS